MSLGTNGVRNYPLTFSLLSRCYQSKRLIETHVVCGGAIIQSCFAVLQCCVVTAQYLGVSKGRGDGSEGGCAGVCGVAEESETCEGQV